MYQHNVDDLGDIILLSFPNYVLRQRFLSSCRPEVEPGPNSIFTTYAFTILAVCLFLSVAALEL